MLPKMQDEVIIAFAAELSRVARLAGDNDADGKSLWGGIYDVAIAAIENDPVLARQLQKVSEHLAESVNLSSAPAAVMFLGGGFVYTCLHRQSEVNELEEASDGQG